MTNIEKLEFLKKNDAFVQEMNPTTTAENIQALFLKYGFDLTREKT